MADPAERDQLLQAICTPLGLHPDASQLDRLLGYLDLMQRWNATYNLTAVRDRAGMLTQHLADCLAVVPAVQRFVQALPVGAAQTGAMPLRVLDVGSGGGLPGVVLAIMLPQLQVTCVDAVGKKAAFVRQVAGALALPGLQAAHARVEALQAPPFHLVTSRAFASLLDFTSLTARHLLPGAAWMAMKGKLPEEEMAALPARVELFHVEQLQVPGLDADRCLLWMRPKAEPPQP